MWRADLFQFKTMSSHGYPNLKHSSILLRKSYCSGILPSQDQNLVIQQKMYNKHGRSLLKFFPSKTSAPLWLDLVHVILEYSEREEESLSHRTPPNKNIKMGRVLEKNCSFQGKTYRRGGCRCQTAGDSSDRCPGRRPSPRSAPHPTWSSTHGPAHTPGKPCSAGRYRSDGFAGGMRRKLAPVSRQNECEWLKGIPKTHWPLEN